MWTNDTPVCGAIEEDVDCLFERSQHKHTLLEFRDAKPGNTQYLFK